MYVDDHRTYPRDTIIYDPKGLRHDGHTSKFFGALQAYLERGGANPDDFIQRSTGPRTMRRTSSGVAMSNSSAPLFRSSARR